MDEDESISSNFVGLNLNSIAQAHRVLSYELELEYNQSRSSIIIYSKS